MTSYVVGRRTHENGIRMALGAEPRRVMGMVVWQALRFTAVGIVIGVAAAFAATQSLVFML